MRCLAHALVAATALAFATTASAADKTWNCPSGEYAREAIISGDVESWPYFTPGPAMRVQKQFPKTALSGQAKYIERNGTTGAICQYYNHVGFAITMYAIGATKIEPSDGAYWRKEYSESSPENDDPKNPMIEVCMVDKDGLSHLSVGCGFKLPE